MGFWRKMQNQIKPLRVSCLYIDNSALFFLTFVNVIDFRMTFATLYVDTYAIDDIDCNYRKAVCHYKNFEAYKKIKFKKSG